MVVPDHEMNSQSEVESALQQMQSEQQPNYKNNNNHTLISSLGRQSSIYSLTLDEFQHALCENGKNFGSMNMDEFLSSIWSAEENQQATNNHNIINNNDDNNNNNFTLSLTETERGGAIRKQPSLARQGSLTIPAPLCRKTVDEVWSEIHKGQLQSQQPPQQNSVTGNNNNNNNNKENARKNTESAPRQPTFGEMTLEDFLVKAGVVREQCATMPVVPQHPQLQQFGMYGTTNNTTVGPSFVSRPVTGAGGGGGGNVVVPSYQTVGGANAIGESSFGNGKRDHTMFPVAPGVVFGGRVVNGGGGYAAPANMGIGAPVSPVSPENSGGGQFGMEMGVLRGRKRMIDGPVEKVVERRQRRMIKNRESAARSRARKQAYTVELEAELNQLKEENAQLKIALAELERRRKQQHLEEVNGRVQSNYPQKGRKRLRSLRRNLSCPL